MAIGPTGIWTDATPNSYPKSLKLAEMLWGILDHSKWIIDFGCGDGYYLNYLNTHNVPLVIGFDGYKSVDKDFVFESDLSKPRNFPVRGQVLSLEVGEHIPVQYEQTFIDNLCRHCDSRLVLSWALPGQNGHGHVNCRPNEYVIEQVEQRGFKFHIHQTNFLRSDIEMHVSYFKTTLMVFDKK